MKNVAGAWGVWQNATALSYPNLGTLETSV
jgi:hypothetical protein